MRISPFNGMLVLDKPRGITSRDAVDRAQRWFPRSVRLGHTGTLDPLATGVLVLCVGSATRLTEYVQHMDKVYETIILLGERSDTDDADGTLTVVENASVPTREQIAECLRGFLGEIEQVPPIFSAAKVSGDRAYELARAGQQVMLSARRVRVDGIDLRSYDYPRLELEIRCGKGTYIRSIARDLGERLGCGGLVEVLRRTRVGPFRAEDGVSPGTDRETARAKLLPVATALADLPRVEITPDEAAAMRQGRAIALRDVEGDEAAAFTPDGTLVGVVAVDRAAALLRPTKVLAGS
jgi:tRNA pseudouridine55 synthase